MINVTVACPWCGQMGAHMLGERVHREPSEDHVQVMAWGRAEPVYDGPVDRGGDFIGRTCLWCGHTWQQREDAP